MLNITGLPRYEVERLIHSILNFLPFLVPGEGFEPPTFGLQNRCTTTVLTRQIIKDLASFAAWPQGPRFAALHAWGPLRRAASSDKRCAI